MKYNQEFLYLNYKFNISVELNTEVEKRMNGVRKHTIIINDMGCTNYYLKAVIPSEKLQERIKEFKEDAKNWVDAREANINPLTEEEKFLIEAGFKKQ